MAFALGMRMLLAARSWPKLSPAERVWSLLEGAALAALTACVGWSRVYLSYHSTDQVLAAVGLGLVIAFAWYTTMRVICPRVGKLAQTGLGRALMLNDTWTQSSHNSQERSHQD